MEKQENKPPQIAQTTSTTDPIDSSMEEMLDKDFIKLRVEMISELKVDLKS